MARFFFLANCRETLYLKETENQATASRHLVKKQITHCEYEKAQLLIYNRTFTKRLPVGSSLPLTTTSTVDDRDSESLRPERGRTVSLCALGTARLLRAGDQ